MRVLAGFMVGLVLSTAPAAAAEQLFLCTVNDGVADGAWISSDYAFLVDAEAKTIVISDPVILYFNKARPVEGTLTSATPAKTAFSWFVFASNNAGQRTKMIYRAVLFTETMEFSVSARPTGYENVFSARGNCTPG